jgi:head-tail adaptor
MDPGQRESLVTFQRGTPTGDDYTTEGSTSWATLVTAWARIKYGTGQERREAAQERMIQSATFECDWNTTLATVAITDRITFESESWDIVSKAPLGHREIHFAAVRSS